MTAPPSVAHGPSLAAHPDLDRPITALVERAAAAAPDRVALQDRLTTLTYRALVERVGRWARALTDLGVGPEDVVGLALDRSAEMVVAALAIARARGSYLPIDPRWPAARVAEVVEDAGVTVVIGGAEGLLPEGVRVLRAPAEAPLSPEAPHPAPSSRAYLLYTSGSTGRPKGVEVEHRSLTALLLAVAEATHFDARHTFLATSSLSFDVAAAELYLPLISGGRVWVAERADLEDRARFDEAVRASGATHLQATPSGWRQLLRLGFAGDPSLVAFTVGEPLTRELADAVLARARTFYNFYGPTEATVYATVAEIARDGAPVTIGRPLAGYAVRVTDDDGAALPAGTVGELRIGGVGVARGYLRRPELTQSRFVAGEYRTGDRAQMSADGEVTCLGRQDDQVKVRGYRVELGEVDAALLAQPDVDAAVTVKRGEERLVSYVVPRRRAASTGDAAFGALFDAAYGARGDTSGYASSYTGQPLPADELAQQFPLTAQRLAALGRRRIYEIGCGNGPLATHLAAGAQDYLASDLSPRGVQAVRAALGARVRAWVGDAADFSAVPAGAVDLVVLHSVVQYFPDATYTLSVLDGAMAVLPPGGVLYVGDVRHADLLEHFWRSVITARAGGPLEPTELSRRAQAAMEGEKELLFRPQAFAAWAAARGDVARLWLELRPGRADNELTRYRFDVFVEKGPVGEAAPARPTLEGPVSLDALIAAVGPRGLRLRGAPNARLTHHPTALHPEDVRALAAARGLAAHLMFSWSDPLTFDADLAPPGERTEPAPPPDPTGLGPPAAHVRARRDRAGEAQLARALREALTRRLPEYAVPAQVVVLPSMPLNAAGKIDRGALPGEAPRPALAVPFRAPESEAERRACQVLEEHLGVRPVGLDDGFYDLGGNSILALSITLQLQREWGRELSTVAFLREGTAAALARLVEGAPSGLDPLSPLVPLVVEGARTPLFFLHASGGRPHLLMDLVMQLRSDRPLYFVQDPAWTGRVPRTHSITEMASTYLTAIRQVQPRGPYYLGGYCLGGVVGLELAQQLEAQGERVARLLMVDPSMPRRDTLSMLEIMRTQVQAVTSYFPQLADQAYAKLSARAAQGGRLSRWAAELGGRVLEDARDRVAAARQLPEHTVEVLGAHADTRTLLELMAHHVRLWGEYEPRPWNGRAALALSTIPSPFNSNYPDDLLGWRRILSQEPEVLRIAGATHFDMGSRPQVFRIAELFKRVMAEADAEQAR